MNIQGYAKEIGLDVSITTPATPKIVVPSVIDYARTTEFEWRYFASDLNKFANAECTKQMSVINGDCYIYKKEFVFLRLIEYKPIGAELGVGQRETLEVMAHGLKFEDGKYSWPFGMYIFHAHSTFMEAWVTEIKTGREYYLCSKRMIVDWIEAKINLDGSPIKSSADIVIAPLPASPALL